MNWLVLTESRSDRRPTDAVLTSQGTIEEVTQLYNPGDDIKC
ncbi:hypothetical protein J2T20_001836 [Paenibacillus wynnii]|nr:hypothetical protein [Paenibacillus wynnii]